MRINKALLLATSNLCSMAAESGEKVSGAAATAATPAAAAEAAKPKTTLEGMTGYRTFATTDEATAYLAKCNEDFSDFAGQPFAMIGVDESGAFRPDVYTPEMRVRVAVLRNVPRTVNGKREPTTIKAIVVTPVPSIPSILGIDAETWEIIKDSPSVAFAVKTLDKELNHIAVRPLRDAENLDTAMEQVPTTLAGFIESNRDAGGIMDTFNDLYKTINDTLSKQVPLWSKARLIKAEMKKAMESKAYALEYYPALEDRGTDSNGKAKDSLFVLALQFGIKLAKSKGADSAIFDKWVSTRDAQTLAASTADDDDDISLDDLVADMGEPAAEPEAVEAEAAAE
jgi:hypothetical protein